MERQVELRKAIEAPYVSTMSSEARDKIIGHDRSISFVFNEINKQAIDSFGIFKSDDFPGVSFSTIHLSITPDLIRKVANNKPTSEVQSPQKTKDQVWFVEPAFGFGDVGNAFSALDMAIDRFIREMPKVARAIKHGEIPPKVDIYVLGSPIALGGSVTEAWRDEVNKEGFDTHGKLYAEFVERKLPKDLNNTRVVVTGPSRGSVTSERTLHFLPDEIKQHTQGLHDIPAGNQSRILPLQVIKSVNMGVGQAAELAVRMVGDRTTKDLGKTEGTFFKTLKEIKEIPQDSKEQSDLKMASFIGEVKALAKGTPPDLEERSYYRAPEFDPVNIKFEGIVDRGISFAKRRPMSFRSKGRKLIASTSRKAHNFPWKKSFGRWEQVLSYCETA